MRILTLEEMNSVAGGWGWRRRPPCGSPPPPPCGSPTPPPPPNPVPGEV